MRTVQNFGMDIGMCCYMCTCYMRKKAVYFYARLNV